MAIYAFTGLDKTGKEIKSTINSENEANAKSKIKSMGIMLIDLKEKKAKKKSSTSLLPSNSVNVNELALMTRQLATLIKARIQIVEALNALMNQVDSEVLRVVLSEVRGKVNEGHSLAKALGEHPNVFDNVYVNMVDAGESSGTLDVVLLKLADFTEAKVKLKNKLQSAMIYPVVISTFGFVMINIIFIYVIPELSKMFKSSKKELPALTKATMAISEFMQNYWWMVFLAIIGLVWFTKKYIATESGQRKWHSLQLKLPILGPLTRMINVSRFCSTLATLLTSGVPILVSMKIVKNLVPNVWMKDAIEESRSAVSEGASMTGPLVESGLYPSMVTHMIKLGEQSGELEDMLLIVADNYQDQVDSKVSGLTSILEPIMMVGIGVTVALIVFSVIMPMMELNKIN
jgi:general secretion pathway protein F